MQNVRQVGRHILEHVSDTRGLSPGLQFLCHSGSSLTAILSALKHALKLVQLDSVLVNFHSLHHFFFILCKIFKEGFTPTNHVPGSSSDELKFAAQGGFLRQPTFGSVHVNDGKQLGVEKKLWENFKFEIAKVAWPSVKKCLHEGKSFIDNRISQMTCVRLLEFLPVVLGELSLSPDGFSGKSLKKKRCVSEFSWLLDLMDWGKSSLEAIIRYWKLSVTSLLTLLKSSCNEKSAAIIRDIEKKISSNAIPMDSLTEQVSRLSVSLGTKGSSYIDESDLESKPSDGLADGVFSDHDDADVQILDTLTNTNEKNKDSVIILSDEETEPSISPIDVGDHAKPNEVHVLVPTADKTVPQHVIGKKTTSESKTSKITSEASETRVAPKAADSTSMIKHVVKLSTLPKIKDTKIGEKEINSKSVSNEHLSSLDKVTAKYSSIEAVKTKPSADTSKQTVAQSNDKILRDLVRNIEDPLELALKSAGRHHSSLTKQVSSLPKRKVIQLAGPAESRSGYIRRMEAAARRFKPPKLDDWFRPILEIDYFAAVGLASAHEEENKTPCDLKEVPVSFESPKQYVDIFRPLVLEEFKAQLRSSFQELSSLEEMSCGSLSVVSVERIDDFHFVRCVYEDHELSESCSCMENDLVLFTKQSLKNSPHHVHIVGKVERREKDNKRRQNMLLIRFYLQSGYSRHNRARKLLLERSKWFLSRIMSITPQLREFQALSSIDIIPALSVILKPSYHSHNERRNVDLGKLSRTMQQVLTSIFNESQLQAISTVIEASDCRDDFELSLVQGPPGTGKTHTIVALISALLAVSPRSNFMEKQSTGNTKVNPTQFNSRARISESTAIARAWQDAALARQMNNEMEKDKKVSKVSFRKRVLVCAQSNAAVDELVARLAGEGLYGVDGNKYKPYLVRVGNAKTIHPNSLPFFIDTLVEHRLAEEKMNADGSKESDESSTMLRESLEKMVDRIKFYESKRANFKDGWSDKNCAPEDEHLEADNGKKLSHADLESRLRILYQQKREIYMRLATIQSREKKNYEEIKALRNKLRRQILREAEIVVTTLSGCGGDLYATCFESASNCKATNISEQNLFDVVVIDEAAQALEPATLIPLQLLKSTGTKCIMVGDPKQLPATVLSNVASRYLYECSMFERLQRAGHPVIMLTEQYRMHPEISHFPSLHFYDGKLLNGVQLSSKTAAFHKTKGLGPYVFYDVIDGQELYGKNSGSSSLYNEGEADAAIEIVKLLQKRYPSEVAGGRIGIITPYKSQLSLLRSRFSSVFGSSISSEMEFNTVDGFQGREVDILILSTVRSSDTSSASTRMNSSSIGFVADVRRMNVALTRAKLSLWILGNAKTLRRNSDWAALIKDAEERNLLISVGRPYKSMFDMILDKSSNSNNSGGYRGTDSEKVERSHHVKQTEKKHEMNLKRKGKYTGSTCSRKEKRDGHDKSAASECLQSAKRKKDVTDTYKELSEKLQNLEDTCESAKNVKTKGANQCEQENDSTNKNSKPLGSSGLEKHIRHKSLENKSGSASHVDRKLQNKGTDETCQPSNEIDKPKDLISKRKQQREAVDALLSSALIPSKKSGSSSKAVPQRRPLSPSSNTGSCVRPTKQQKDLKAETRGKKKDKSSNSLGLRRNN